MHTVGYDGSQFVCGCGAARTVAPQPLQTFSGAGSAALFGASVGAQPLERPVETYTRREAGGDHLEAEVAAAITLA